MQLLTGPFVGLDVHAKTVQGRPWRPLAVLLGATVLVAALLGGLWDLQLGVQARALEDTGIRLMPTVEVRDGRASLRGDARTVDAGSFLLVLDTSVHPLPSLPGDPGDARDVVHVGETSLVVYRRATAEVFPIAWAQLEAWYGPQVFDGPSVVPFLLRVRHDVTRLAATFAGALAVGWQLLLVLLLAGLHRAVSFRDEEPPTFGGLVAVASQCALPALAVAGAALAVGASQATAVGLHLVVVVALLFAVVARLRVSPAGG